MDLTFTKQDLNDFAKIYSKRPVYINAGGMGAPDVFTLWFTLKKLQPETVIESGVWKGASTWIIRQALPNADIVCLDPLDVREWIDPSPKTRYKVDYNFADFSELLFSIDNPETTLAFFDDHFNTYERIQQAHSKGIKHLFFNDNYPVGCGSHISPEHILKKDRRFVNKLPNDARNTIESIIQEYHVFPNVYSDFNSIRTGEGEFSCESMVSESEVPKIFIEDSKKYRWNTYIKLT